MTGDLQLSQEEISTAREAGWRVVDVIGTRLARISHRAERFGQRASALVGA
jgi:hypothetical protein